MLFSLTYSHKKTGAVSTPVFQVVVSSVILWALLPFCLPFDRAFNQPTNLYINQNF